MTQLDPLMPEITIANKAYRKGNPIMTDQEYDDMLETLSYGLNPKEFEAFRRTLMDGTGKVNHSTIIGSLNKTKLLAAT